VKSNIAEELMSMKNTIESAKAEKNRIEGELRQMSKSMIDEFGTDNPAEIQIKIDGLQKQADSLKQSIEKEMKVLREELGNV